MSLVPQIWRVSVTVPAGASAGTIIDATVNIPDPLSGAETSYSTVQLNYGYTIDDGYMKNVPTEDFHLILVFNDGEDSEYSNPVSVTVLQAGRPREPLFSDEGMKKVIDVAPNTKLKVKVRLLEPNTDTVDHSYDVILRVIPHT